MRRRLGRDHISWRLGRLTSGLDNQGLTTLPDNQTLVRLLRLGVKLLLLLLRLVKRRADILQRGAIGGLLLLEHLSLHLLGLVHHRPNHATLLLKILLLLLLLHGLLLEILLLLHIVGLKVILLLLRHHVIKSCIIETAAAKIILVLVKGHLVVKAYHVLLLVVHGLVHALLSSHHVGLGHALVHHSPLVHLVHPVSPIHSVPLPVVHPLLIVLLLVWLLLVLETASLLVLLVVATTSEEAPTSKHRRAEFLLASRS